MKNYSLNIQWLKFLVFPCLLLMLLTSSCSKDDDPAPGGEKFPKEVNIEYRITSVRGIQSGDVIYHNETGGTTILDKVSLPYSVQFKRTVKFSDNLALSFNTIGSGEVKAEILVDGKVVTTENYAGTSVISGTAVHIFQ